jgi:hypothetical protein
VSSPVTHAAALATALVGVGIMAWAGWRFGSAPLPLSLTLVGTGVLLVVLGLGIRRGLRAAWAFAVSVLGVVGAAGLLAMPGIVRAGAPPVVAGLALAVVVGVLFLVISARDPL